MYLSYSTILRTSLAAVLLAMTGCGSGSDDNAASATTETLTAVSIEGVASKGPIADANIDLWPADVAGQPSGSGSLLSTVTDGTGHWFATLNSGAQLLIATSRGGSYVDESDSTPDPALKRVIQLAANDELQGLALSGSSTAAINIISQAMLTRARMRTGPVSFPVAVDAVRSEAIQVFGFDIFTVLPQDPIAPDPASPEEQRQYALLLGGLANVLNDIAVRNGIPVPIFSMVEAVSQDLSDCLLNGQDSAGTVYFSLNGSFVALPTDLDLNGQVIRFRNNNFVVFSGTAVPVVDPTACSVNPPSGDTIAPVFLQVPPPFTVAASDANGTLAADPAIAGTLAQVQAVDDSGDPVQIIHDAPPIFALGETLVTFIATDSSGNTSLATTRVAVRDQAAPSIQAPADITQVQDGALTVVNLGLPVVADNVTTVGLLIVSNDAPAAGFPVGLHTVVWTVRDEAGLISTASQSLTITTPNAPQLLQPVPDSTATEGQFFSINLAAFFSDSDGDALSFALLGLPTGSGLQFDPVSGILSGFPSDSDAKSGPLNLTVSASDLAESVSDSFLLSVTDVNNPPAFSVADLLLAEDFAGTVVRGVVPGPVTADESGQSVIYSISPDPALTGFANLVFDPASGTLSATAAANMNGGQIFTITADDGQAVNNTWQQNFLFTVTAINDAPVFSIPGDIVLPLNFPGVVGFAVTPAAVNPDETSQTVTYTISPPIDFAAISIDPNTGQVTITRLPDLFGSQLMIITAFDNGAENPSHSEGFVLTVGP
ncbi:MAG: putative Ig domain-containing protein [Gammaproteobacteria bacterium]|nr:putative Ig domain-containing protein [Gammaproteobacteria bacterium]